MSNQLYAIISRVMSITITEITSDSSRSSIPNWDSFNMFVLLDEIEQELNVKFSLEEIVEIETVGDIEKIINSQGVNFDN
jgi:acyl carrier protein